MPKSRSDLSVWTQRPTRPTIQRDTIQPLSRHATVILSKMVSTSANKHPTGFRMTVPALKGRGECSSGACWNP